MVHGFVIFPGNDLWTIARVNSGPTRPEKVQPSGIAAALATLGYRDNGVILALPSRLCLCASVEDSGLRGSSKPAGLVFRLEEQLPLAIEDLEADFVAHKGKSLGIAVEVKSVQPLLNALQEQGIIVTTICPAALLVAAGLNVSDGAIVSHGNHGTDLMLIENGKVAQWTYLTGESATLKIHLRQLLPINQQLIVRTIGVSGSVKEQIASLPGIELQSLDDTDYVQMAANGAANILQSGASPPVQLCRGNLASNDPLLPVRRPLRMALAAAILLCLSLIGSMFWRAGRYNALAQDTRTKQEQAFHWALPNQAMPFSITTRLLSEQKRLGGLSGTASGVPDSPSVLPLVRDTLAGLPRDLRFRLVELRFEPQQLYLEGRALDHSAADQIAQAIRHSTHLFVDPPHTEQPAGEDVIFTLSATETSDGNPPAIIASDRQEGTGP